MKFPLRIAAVSVFAICLFWLATPCLLAEAPSTRPFDGSPWNISTGNLSVSYIRCSPIGAAPQPGYQEPPPAPASLKWDKDNGLVNFEDYVAWGAVEREPGQWDWSQHDSIEHALHAAGLHYVVYDWVHFPPVWLRDQQKDQRTLMRCMEHNQETNYLSIFDPRTIQWYDHFYKALSEHFGDKIDGVYACILGPYGEGNYPLNVPDFVNIGHCHEGYWCADPYAIRAFRAAIEKQYSSIDAVNHAWGTSFGSFEEITPPPQLRSETFKPSPAFFTTPAARHRWVDFITWYHQAIIDFAGKSIETTLKYFPKNKVRTKPGGNAGGVNPLAWGTYCPGYAKMAAKYGIVLQPADWHGAYFGDKWVATAYHFYHVTLSTEPAGGLDHAGMLQSLFSDASCGARQLFTYDFPTHAADIQKYAHLINGQPGQTQVAVLCPTTLYRLGGDLGATIKHAAQLRDLTDYDVLDELLVADGALTTGRYKALLVFQSDFIDQPILDKLRDYVNAGGTILFAGSDRPTNLDSVQWKPALAPGAGKIIYCGAKLIDRFKRIAAAQHLMGYDGVADGVWTTRRGGLLMRLNVGWKPAIVDGITIAPHELWSNE